MSQSKKLLSDLFQMLKVELSLPICRCTFVESLVICAINNSQELISCIMVETKLIRQ